MKSKVLIISILLLIYSSLFAQEDRQLGVSDDFRQRAGLYDLSDPGAVNIKVSVWGYVTRPGKYIVPDYTSVSDLLSYAGGPNQNAEMDDMRIFRILEDGSEQIVKFTYDDVMWGSGIEVKNRLVPELLASDVLIVPGSPRLFFSDWFRLGLQVFTALISVINLYVLILRYNR